MNPRMTLEDFRALVDGYGADPDRWPDELKPEAERFAAASSEAQAVLAAEAELDALLRAGPKTASPALRAQLLAIPTTRRQDRKKPVGRVFGLPVGFLAPRFAGALAAGALGFLIGFNGLFAELYPTAQGSSAAEETVDLSAMIYGLDVEEISL
ncbi:MAG: hypothetical protein R3360_09635 [Alphaproteobacteria bacterium]|nr:hypothetical protein [Alphaproteobacteria bacterium]